MNNFPELIASWETFYLLTGTAAATLMGLLFVAVSIHIDDFHDRTSADLHLFAALTFNCFFYVLVLSIFFLVPGLSGLGLGIPLLIFSLLAVVNAFVQKRRARRSQGSNPEAGLAGRFNLPIVSLIALVLVAIGVLLHIGLSLYGLVLVVILLLISASLNAWSLLVLTPG